MVRPRTSRRATRSVFTLAALSGSLFVAAILAAAATPATTANATTTTTAPGTLAPINTSYRFAVNFDGVTRAYQLHVPPQAAAGKPLPLVMNLHGDTQNGFLEEAQTGMDSNADQNGYLVVYPNGTRVSKVLTPDPVAKQAQYGWNAGYCCALPEAKKINDVGFLLKVIADVAKRTPVNLRKVYVTGISSGGMMANALAAQAAGHIAAVASVEGPLEIPTIHPSRGVPAMEFASVTDPIVPFKGTPNKNPKLVLSAQEGVNQWVKADGCSTTPHTSPTIVGAAGSTSAGLTATLITYTGCKGGEEVDFWKQSGSGHVWPGTPLNIGTDTKAYILGGVGRGTTLINANELMWTFFNRFELPASA